MPTKFISKAEGSQGALRNTLSLVLSQSEASFLHMWCPTKGYPNKGKRNFQQLAGCLFPSLGESHALQLRQNEYWEENKVPVIAEHSALGLCVPMPIMAPSKLLRAKCGGGRCL